MIVMNVLPAELFGFAFAFAFDHYGDGWLVGELFFIFFGSCLGMMEIVIETKDDTH